MRAIARAVLTAQLGVAAALLAGCEQGTPTRIVLITLDTLRYDRFAGAAGQECMPETRAFAERGLRFENHFATTSCTQPTHASLLTGLYPWEHGVTRNGVVLEKRHRTLAEELKARGFKTHAVVASFPLHRTFGFAQGFDSYDDDFDESYVKAWEGEPVEGSFFSLSKSVTDRALAALDRTRGDKQFFWFHYFDPHDPYGDSADEPLSLTTLLRAAIKQEPGFDEQLELARQLYDRDVREMDRALGRLLQGLREDEDRFETHVLLTADHGESFGELGSIGHGLRVTREQVHVPLVIVSPRLQAGTRIDPCSSVDIPRTLLSLLESDRSAPEKWGGRDLLSSQSATVVLGMRRTFAEPRREFLADGRKRRLSGPCFFVVQDGVLLSGDGAGVFEEDDPDRLASGENAARMRANFTDLERALAATEVGREVLDDETQARLRRLGYTR